MYLRPESGKFLKMSSLKTKNEHPLTTLMFSKHYLISIRVIFISILTIAIVGGLGYYLDTITNHKPLFTIISLIIAFPLMQLLIYKSIHNLTNKHRGQHSRN